MPRANRSVPARARHKKVLDAAKGFRGRRKNVYRIAKQTVMKAGQYAYRDRSRGYKNSLGTPKACKIWSLRLA